MPDTRLPEWISSVTGAGDEPDSADVDGYVLRAPDLKATIMDCYFAGYITKAEAEDLIQFYGLVRA